MADNFGAENLEDGEQWLPPDFFSIEEVQISNKKSTPFNYCSSSTPSSMEVLQRRRPSGGLYKPITTLQPFEPPVWYGSCAYDPCSGGMGRRWTGFSSINRLPRLNPVQAQVESSMGAVLYEAFPAVAMSPRAGTGVFLPPVDENQKLSQRGKGRSKLNAVINISIYGSIGLWK